MADIISEVVLYLISSGIVVTVLRWVAKRVGWHTGREEALAAIEAISHRVVDKYRAEREAKLVAAKDPNSDGGVEVTDAEKAEANSAARDAAYRALLDGLKGEALDYVKALGPDIVKGMIGRWVSKRDKAS